MTKQTSTPASLIAMPESYGNWLSDLKSRIQTAQQRAAPAAQPATPPTNPPITALRTV